jgi:threonine aldolase
MKIFASDNSSGVHEMVWQAMRAADKGNAVAYGNDPWTKAADEKFAEVFGPEAEAYFVFGGTGANVAGLASLCRRWDAVICADSAHIHVDECGAPEKVGGVKLLPVPNVDGKISPESVRPHLHGFGFEHHAQPRAISVTQSTEYGTLYSRDEIRAMADLAHEYDMYLHMDGARLANAAAAMGCSLNELTGASGVDVLSFGGTKNGLMFGEAVVFFGKGLAENFKFVRKQCTQLYSKLRYVSAQFSAYLTDELWRECAAHANAMAGFLAEEAGKVPGIEITRPVEVNAVFATMPPEAAEELKKDFYFLTWDAELNEVRWMTSFSTQEDDILEFVSAMRRVMGG